MAPLFGNNGQLTRDERLQLHGIDCEDQIVWSDWTPGVESVKDLQLRNVALVTQKVKFKLPNTKEFDMPYPEPFKLAPGMKKSIPISFRPSKYEPHVDRVQIVTKGGSFFVVVKAVVKDIALTVPPFVDFGMCPIAEKSAHHIEVYNTGGLKALMRWHVKAPFAVKTPTNVIDVGQMIRCVVEFQPHAASVFDGLIACETSNASEDAALDDDVLISSRTVPKDTKQYFVQATGVGKMPHLCVPGTSSPVVDFGAVFPGSRTPQTLEIVNTTPVRATFRVHALLEDREVVPLPPSPFSVSPESGVVESAHTFTLTFSFQSHTVKEFTCQRFQVTTPGGTTLVVTCKAECRPMEVRLSTKSINFGMVPSGNVYTKTLQLHNETDRPAIYHFVNVDHAKGIFWMDRHMGVVPSDSFMVVTVFFGPNTPINFHKQLTCLIKGGLMPLTLNLLGSAFTDKARPALLEQHHVDIFRSLQLSGIREHSPPPENKQLPDLATEDLQEQVVERTLVHVANAKPLSATAMFLEMMLPMDSKLRDITIAPADIDFGSVTAWTNSEKQIVVITNRTSQKVNVVWMICGETRMLCNADEKALFTVYPVTSEIKPYGHAEFTLTMRPQHTSYYEGEILEAVVFAKVNRSFRLVDLERFTPPWTLAIRGMGHTMGSTRNDPRLDISESHIRFRACYAGERTYQVVMLTNPGDTAVAYRILPAISTNNGESSSGDLQQLQDSTPFRAWPLQGIIPPHQFNLIALEFAPTCEKNEKAFTATFQIIVDYNEMHPKTLRVCGRAWEPKVSFCGGTTVVTFPPTCSGITSAMGCSVKNISEIPIAFECKIPSRFRSLFWFENGSGELGPSESTTITAHFCPSSEKVFSAPLYCSAMFVENASNCVEGPLKSLMAPTTTTTETSPNYVLQFVGHGKGPALSLEPDTLDLGAVKACEEVAHRVSILNSSSLTVHYTTAVMLVAGPEGLDRTVCEDALRLNRSEGSVAARCTESLDITFQSIWRGLFEYRIIVTPNKHGRGISLMFRAEVQYPRIQIADLRTESVTVQPQSMMWTQFQVDGINELFRGEIAQVERRFQAAIGIDEKKNLVKQLKPFQLLFGTAAAGSQPSAVYLALANPGRLPIRFSFQTPKNLNLENVPYWCDEKALVDDREAHFSWVEEHNIYDIQPRSGEIAAGAFVHIKMSYNHHSIGTHILPVVFNVHDGRSILLYLKAHSVAPNVGCLSIRSSVVMLQAVPLNVAKGSTQSVELTNSGCVAAPWRVDMRPIHEHNRVNHNFDILQVEPLGGVLGPQSSTFLHFTFTPLEAKKYHCPVRIEMLKDGRPAEELCFELEAEGYTPKEPVMTVDPLFPASLPIQTYAPVPGCGAALSIEILDFDSCPIGAQVSRMLVLVNYTSEFVLGFRWESNNLFMEQSQLKIEPSFGELSPGSYCIVVFRLHCLEAVDVCGEVACMLEWAHLSEYDAEFEEAPEQALDAKPEILAFHSDHMHDQIRTGKGYVADANRQRISVANRLTVSRFRHLMSTAAGQKFLNENLHRTAVLSSDVSAMVAHKALQASTSTMGKPISQYSPPELNGGSLAEASRTISSLQRPTAFPLNVRIRAVVADWAVPRERWNEFLVVRSPGTQVHNASEVTAESATAASEGMDCNRTMPKLQRLAEHPHADDFRGMQRCAVMTGVLDRLTSEIMTGEDFVSIMNKMIMQDSPYFIQFENSTPPGDLNPDWGQTDAGIGPAAGTTQGSCEARAEEQAEAVAKTMLLREDGHVWTSSMLLDFEASCPDGFTSTAGTGMGAVPKGSSCIRTATAGAAIDTEPIAGVATGDFPRRSWVEAAEQYGDVDLDAFSSAAGEVLDRILLDMMDDVVAGRLNWMRPLPRARSRK